MSDETNERYVLEVMIDVVLLEDHKEHRMVGMFTGPARLLAATTELNRLKDQDEIRERMAPAAQTYAGIKDHFTKNPAERIAPAEFLAKRLPDVARRQRLEGHLAEVTEIEESLLRVLAEDAANLKRATVLREKLEKELASPLSEPLLAQNADLVGQDTLDTVWALRAGTPLFKPQPY